MDDADRAQTVIEREEVRWQRRAADKKIESRERCRDCCEPIPEARRQAMPGCQRCADCARDYERELRR
jgi:phage/conjugal plasmid C-4 type zinc finger TraR family protein